MPAAAAPPSAPAVQSAHDLGLSMGIAENALTAVELQAGSDSTMTVEDLANIPEIFYMRALDRARLADTDLAPFFRRRWGL